MQFALYMGCYTVSHTAATMTLADVLYEEMLLGVGNAFVSIHYSGSCEERRSLSDALNSLLSTHDMASDFYVLPAGHTDGLVWDKDRPHVACLVTDESLDEHTVVLDMWLAPSYHMGNKVRVYSSSGERRDVDFINYLAHRKPHPAPHGDSRVAMGALWCGMRSDYDCKAILQKQKEEEEAMV